MRLQSTLNRKINIHILCKVLLFNGNAPTVGCKTYI